MTDTSLIRNFCIIAHIDHGKSTLADRLLELTHAVAARDMRAQYLDKMDLERERGITIKAQAVRLAHTAGGKTFELNLIDTPGHVDFTYEVSRSLEACEGAVLLVDAAQGLEAQTLANYHLARDAGLTIIPVLNKIDLPAADPEGTARDVAELVGCSADEVLAVSAKTGEGVPALLDAVIARVPPPEGDPAAPLRALIFDSMFDAYRGVIVYVRVIDGVLPSKARVRLMATKLDTEAEEAGVLAPEAMPVAQLGPGEVGYLVTGLKDVHLAKVGDTITLAGKHGAKQALPGYREPKPMVWSGLFPAEGGDYTELREALDKLKLSDAALAYEPESSMALGFGFRCGFLGLLHMDIVKERLEREFGLELIATAPNVEFHVVRNHETDVVHNPSEMPQPGTFDLVREPMIMATIITPAEYMGAVLELCQSRRGEQVDMKFLSPERAEIHYVLPLAEIIFDFFDQLKSRTKGYASLDYEHFGYEEADLVRVDVLLHGDPIDAFSSVVHRAKAPGVRPPDGGTPARADPAATVRRRDPGGDRLARDRARDREGETQGRSRQVLRRRHHAQAQAPRAAEEGQGQDEASREGRRPAGGVHRRAPRGPEAGRTEVVSAGIYVHVPFCLTRCGYCDFNAYAGLDHLAPRYVRALEAESDLHAPAWTGERIVSVFFGGGTPTTLETRDLAALLAHLRSSFDVAPDAEVTIEANPDTVDESKLAALLHAGYTRLSMGAQSFDPGVLLALERVHEPASVLGAFAAARAAGHGNVNLDLIYGAERRDARLVEPDARGGDRARTRTRFRVRAHGRAGDSARAQDRCGCGAGARRRPPSRHVRCGVRAPARSRLRALRGLELGEARVRVPPQPRLLAAATVPRARRRRALLPRRPPLVEPPPARTVHGGGRVGPRARRRRGTPFTGGRTPRGGLPQAPDPRGPTGRRSGCGGRGRLPRRRPPRPLERPPRADRARHAAPERTRPCPRGLTRARRGTKHSPSETAKNVVRHGRS